MFLPHTPACYADTTLSMLEQTDFCSAYATTETCLILPMEKTCVNTALQLSVLSTNVPASAVVLLFSIALDRALFRLLLLFWLFSIALDRALREHPASQTALNLPDTEFDCQLIFCGSKSNHFYYAKSPAPSSRIY